MATYTSYLNLEKPTTSETFNLLKMNQNWDKIDAGVSALNSNFANKVLKNIGNMNDAALDALTTAGIYYCWITNDSTCPTKSQWSFLVVMSPDGTHCSQFIVSGQPPWKSGVRYMSGNTWSSWDSKTT